MTDDADETRNDRRGERRPPARKASINHPTSRAQEARVREERRLARLEKQRVRQAKLRAAKGKDRIPDRDDVARMLLHFSFGQLLRPGREKTLVRIVRLLVAKLAQQGFSEVHARRVIDGLLDRYEDGWAFQRKQRLLAQLDDDDAD